MCELSRVSFEVHPTPFESGALLSTYIPAHSEHYFETRCQSLTSVLDMCNLVTFCRCSFKCVESGARLPTQREFEDSVQHQLAIWKAECDRANVRRN